MKSIFKTKSKKTIIILILSIISLVFFISIAYSAFSSTMNISGLAHARVEADVRITDFRISEAITATSSYEEFGKNHVISNIELTSSSSKIYYDLEITNYGSLNVGIYSITGLPEGLNYSIEDYNLKDMICDDYNKCNSMAVQTYRLGIYTNNIDFNGTIQLEFEFRPVYKITYTNFIGNYTSHIISGDSLTVDLSTDSPKFIDVRSVNNTSYSYFNNILNLNDVTSDIEVINIITDYNYDYTGDVQTFTAKYDGIYKLETWGAQGGDLQSGYGGYSTGNIKLKKGATVYIYVGGQGAEHEERIGGKGGYNGGGSGGNGVDTGSYNYILQGAGGGGGATHIASTTGLLSNLNNNRNAIYVVAGGGGGGSDWSSELMIGSGSGGGNSGGSGLKYNQTLVLGGTQTSGYAFGQGADGVEKNAEDCGAEGSGGGGGGFYGGQTAEAGVSSNAGGGGGSGYIGNQVLKDKYMVCYECGSSDEVNTKTIETTCISENAIPDCAKGGNGYAKVKMIQLGITHKILYSDIIGSYPTTINDGNDLIVNFGTNAPNNVTVLFDEMKTSNYTYSNGVLTIKKVSNDIEIIGMYSYNFDYTGSEQMFKVSRSGIYKLETWGAQGGSSNLEYGTEGGYGGYSTGTVELKKDQNIYIYVGGVGQTCNSENIGGAGGYNGGGKGGNGVVTDIYYVGGAGGGGATHIAIKEGVLSTLSNNIDSILIVSGGGGGGICWGYSFDRIVGGSGGGISGGEGLIYSGNNISGGTQTSGYAFGQGAPGLQKTSGDCGAEGSGGGGGGFYGGNTSGTGASSNAGGGGGSGYIGNSALNNKYMTCYNCLTSIDTNTKTNSTICQSGLATSDCAKTGNGYAKITLIEIK